MRAWRSGFPERHVRIDAITALELVGCLGGGFGVVAEDGAETGAG
jgi:hypothetical protein